MRAPKFWNEKKSWLVWLLRPISHAFASLVTKRLQEPPRYVSNLPVICVGNVTMGGSGKTPVVQAIVEILKEAGKNPAILLRGYGGSNTGTVLVDLKKHKPGFVGDEALLHAQHTATVVSPDRATGAQTIEKDKWYTHIIMDDGLQNTALKKTLSFMVVDGANPFGNGEIFPAGPLREPIDNAVKRVHAMIVLGKKNTDITTRYGFLLPIFHAELVPTNSAVFAGKKVLAFAGIGNPQKFFDTLRQSGAQIVAEKSFPDHYSFKTRDIDHLVYEATSKEAILVTTRKDWVRLTPEQREKCHVLDVILQWENPKAITDFLHEKGII